MTMLTLSQRNAWCDALRSGHYERCSGTMRAGNAHCALGLACHVLGLNEWQLGARLQSQMAHDIARMNDALGCNYTFPDGSRPMYRYTWLEIANWIERNVPVAEDMRQFFEVSRDQYNAYYTIVESQNFDPAIEYLPPPIYVQDGLSKVLEMFKKQISEACSV
jgi:hypothetical protein